MRKKQTKASENSIAARLKQSTAKVHESCGVEAQEKLHVEKGETVTLSYTSNRFQKSYRQIEPKSIEEVRQAIGVPTELSEQLEGKTCCSSKGVSNSRMFAVEDLTSKDEKTRGAALRFAKSAAGAYVLGAKQNKQITAVLDRYIDIADTRLNLAFFGDVIVEDGATLNIAQSTHALYANKIKIYGNGKIVCQGPTTFRSQSIQGKLNRPSIGSASGELTIERDLPEL